MKKRILSLVLVVVMVISLLPMSAFADEDVGSSEQEEDNTIVVGGAAKHVSIENSGDTVRLVFTPTEDGYYVFRSENCADSKASLYSGENFVKEDDDGGDDYNFKIVYNCAAGETYYLDCNSYEDQDEYDVVVEKMVLSFTWSLEDGVLTISGSGDMTEYGINGAPWDENREAITSVVIEEGITGICEYAFYDYDSLVSVSLPDSVTSINTEAFKNCDKLSSITIPEGVTYIGSNILNGCNSLMEISYKGTIEQWNALEIEKKDNQKLDNIIIHCTDGDIDNPNKCGDNATWSLEDGVLTISGSGEMWFYDWNGAPWYENREAITSVAVEEGITKIGTQSFYDCYNLNTVSFPGSITYIGWGILIGCSSLEEISYKGTTEQWNAIEKEENTKLDSIIIHCTDGDIDNSNKCGDNATWSLEDGVLTISGSGEMWDYDWGGAPWYENREAITSVAVEEGITKIGQLAFYDCYNLNTVSFPGSITYIGCNILSACGSLNEISYNGTTEQWNAIVKGDNQKLYKIIIHCTDGDIDNSNKCGDNATWSLEDGVLTISGSGEMWYCDWGGAPWYENREAITSVVVEEGITEIGTASFVDCYNLNTVSFPGSITYIGWYILGGCSSLKEISYKGTVEQWNAIEKEENTKLDKIIIHCTDGDIDNYHKCGDNATWSLEDGVLTISGSGEMWDYDWNEQPWNENWEAITSVVVEEGITRIGQYAFVECDNLNTVSFPGSITTIGYNILYGCNSLNEISYNGTIEQWNALEIERDANPKLYKIIVHCTDGDIDTYHKCGDNATWSLEDGVLTISGSGEMWYCDWGGAPWYENREAITSVVVEEGITEIGTHSFVECYYLRTVSLPDGLQVIRFQAFYNCWRLTDITLPDSITTIECDAFGGCSSLKEISYKGTIEQWNAIEKDDNANLDKMIIHCTDGDIDNYHKCGDNATWSFEDGVLTISGSGAIWDYNSGYPSWYEDLEWSISSVVIEDGITRIGQLAFSDSDNLETVSIPSTVTSIDPTAFKYCYSLTTVNYSGTTAQWMAIDHPGWDSAICTADITCTDGKADLSAYCGDGNWGSNATCSYENHVLTISGTGGVSDINPYAVPWYDYIDDIESIVIEDGITYIGCIFFNCENLTSLTVPEDITIGQLYPAGSGDYPPLRDIYYGGTAEQWESCKERSSELNFFNSFNIIHFVDGTVEDNYHKGGDGITWSLENGVLTIAGEGKIIYNNWMVEADRITSVVICEGITGIREGAFAGCSNIRSIYIPDSVTEIGYGAFSGCTSLESISIPAGVTIINGETFYNCQNLQRVTLGSGVQQIGEVESYSSDSDIVYKPAFYGCINLSEVEYEGTASGWSAINVATNPNGDLELLRAKTNCTDGEIASAANSCGTDATWSYSDGVLTISGSGKVDDCKYSTAPWAKYKDSITKVVVEEGITELGDFAFSVYGDDINYEYPNLTTVCIPVSMTSFGDSSFGYFGEYYDANRGQYRSKSVVVGTINYAGTMEQWNQIINAPTTFAINCSDGVIDDFYWCGEGEYFGCSDNATWSIQGDVLTISGTGGAASVNNARYYWNAKEIKNISIGEGIVSVGSEMFQYMEIDSVELPESLTTIKIGAFSCTTLESITLPESIRVIEHDAFTGCWSLTDINYEGTVEQWNKVAVLDATLANSTIHCSDGDVAPADISWTFEDGVLTISGNGANLGILWDVGSSEITSVVINEGITSIGSYVFAGCSELTSVSLPESMNAISAGAFAGCDKLKNINIPEGVSYINYDAFACCSSLEELESIGSISTIEEYTFTDCSKLSSVEIPSTVTSIQYCAFSGCSSLASIEIPDSVTEIQYYAFAHCSSLASIEIPDSVTSIGRFAFNGCSSLASVEIPDSVTEIQYYAFACCSSLTNVVIPSSVTDIASHSFEECTSLKNLSIPEGVKYIGAWAFRECRSLETVTLPSSLENLGEGIFGNCTALTDIYFLGTEQQWNELIGDESEDICPEGVTVHFAKEGHVHDYTTEVSAPTCTEQGYTTYTCECGYSYVDNYIDALGHDYVDGVCTRCGAEDPDFEPAEYDCRLSLSNERAKAGEEVTVSVVLEDNPGIMTMNFGVEYDESKLQLLGIEDGIITGWDYTTKVVWIGNENFAEDGEILKFKFKVLEDVEDGAIEISLTAEEGDIGNYDEEIIVPELVSGEITVYSIDPGDINGDGKVNAIDLVRLKKYLSGADVELVGSGDVNGDGKVNAMDLVRLKKYLSGADVVLH